MGPKFFPRKTKQKYPKVMAEQCERCDILKCQIQGLKKSQF